MELLLFLSAMLAGLISGDRAVETRQIERTAVAASVAVDLGTKAAHAAARIAAPRTPVPPRSAAPAHKLILAELELPQAAPVDERRRE